MFWHEGHDLILAGKLLILGVIASIGAIVPMLFGVVIHINEGVKDDRLFDLSPF